MDWLVTCRMIYLVKFICFTVGLAHAFTTEGSDEIDLVGSSSQYTNSSSEVLSTSSSLNDTLVTEATVQSTETVSNVTLDGPKDPTQMFHNIKPGALKRGFIVFAIICFVVVVYLAVRAYRLRGKRKARRYNIVSSKEDAEMMPLHSEDEEEDDNTLFEAPRKISGR